MSDAPATAYFQPLGGNADSKLDVHFNPGSLRVALTNQFGEDPPEQHARPTTTKLDVELIFDSTETGEDIRSITAKLRTMATATATEATSDDSSEQDANHSLSVVKFHWGTAEYQGVIESLTETLDYWSSDGVPLRATVQLSMKSSSLSGIGSTAAANRASDPAPAATPAPPEVTPAPVPDNGKGATEVAEKAGDSKAGRALAALNKMENMRMPAGGSVGVAASANLSAAASFKISGGVSAGASAGFGIGASAGASAGAGLSASAGVGLSGGAGAGIGGGLGGGISGGAGFSAGGSFGAGASVGGSASFGAGASAGTSFGASASAGSGFGTSSTFGGAGSAFSASAGASVTGFDGVTHSTGSSTAGLSASGGAFAGLGASKTSVGNASFSPGKLLDGPSVSSSHNAQFDTTGKLVSGSGQVAASFNKRETVKFF